MPSMDDVLPGGKIENEDFVLDDQLFANLQLYLNGALHLPSSHDDFETKYPKWIFERYGSKDDGLYYAFRYDLVEFNKHCSDFALNTLHPMVDIASDIHNLAESAGERSQKLNEQLQICFAEDAQFENPAILAAAEEAQSIAGKLCEEARAHQKTCELVTAKLTTLKAQTVDTDQGKLSEINRRANAALPQTDTLNQELREAMSNARASLNDLAGKQNHARDRVRELEADEKSGANWVNYLPWVAMGLAVCPPLTADDFRQALNEATKQYDAIAQEASDKRTRIVRFRDEFGGLQRACTELGAVIKPAVDALTHLIEAFEFLKTNLEDIATKLEQLKGYIAKSDTTRRKTAFARLDSALHTCTQINHLATHLQPQTLLLQNTTTKPPSPEPTPTTLTILSATYGGAETTSLAQTLFNNGAHLSIPSVDPGFPEPWHGVMKSISVLHAFGSERRIFACGDKSGTHHLQAGPISLSQNNSSKSVCEVVRPLPRPDWAADAKVRVLAIVWGTGECRSQSAYDYVYGRLVSRAGPIEWCNELFGPDTWPGNLKSGAIYYTSDDECGAVVKQICGREGESSYWN
ncbi:hypothetical protein EJ05DRAFT_515957 [Pseudovirgaria hyperparasitica]|uniref:Uncharacterized protein n=1 Tax=Pseudovirgaria hyperparasitica TaxID=470096 RepID=A0A6A6WID3_9PEZI|nr:uncharacterized protein EJ05DRAFT_515957 [Pseudovirgaria hyperparasitica]KAF2762548.1 hypothetical protein EJ05DRAFT_515957 [Pseudovirgaria hyperparasitica]